MDPSHHLFLCKGLAVGLAIAAPVGPIGLLCIQRTLTGGRISGLVTGLGAASADALYGFAAAFGLTAVSEFLTGQQTLLRFAGALFLVYLGFRAYRQPPADSAAASRGPGHAGAYASTLALTLANPMTILSFAAIFAGMGLAGPEGDPAGAGFMVVGVFLGSAVWWLFLSTAAGLVHSRLSARRLSLINKAFGVIIVCLGALVLLGAVA